MVKTENCLKIGKGVKRMDKKQSVEDIKHIKRLLEIEERISLPLFSAAFPRQEIKK